jgi:hypothetical protein
MASSVATKSSLVVRLVDFNLRVARFAHPSWYESASQHLGWSAAIFDDRGRVNGRAEPHVSRWLLREVGLTDDVDWQMEVPQKRLWLLDGSALQRLACELALAMHREWLSRMIDGARLRALSGRVDERALRFVVGELPADSFHYQAPMVNLDAGGDPDLRARLTEHGARTLMALLQPTWRAVRLRAQLHFDRNQDLAAAPAFEPAHCQRALELIAGWLIPRRFPEWAWCL